MVDTLITVHPDLDPTGSAVEIVERKGLGHPDTICDALAENLSLALCRYYRDRFGLILHHNVDKALLWGGESNPAFGGGEVIAPMEIFLAGRATSRYKGVDVPIGELVEETVHRWLQENLHALPETATPVIHHLVRHGSQDLVDLYERQQQTGIALANDTSCGVGYAPLDDLEQIVYSTEQQLNSPQVKQRYPVIGEDIKVMGVRRAGTIELTIACAMVDRYVRDADDYMAHKQQIADLVQALAAGITDYPLQINVNTADVPEQGSFYLTVTGTSAEAGDDGEVGRGNRSNGLITPYRPMNMEAAAGKNPVTHVGKLYNLTAQRLAADLVGELTEVLAAQCFLVSRIGQPIREPWVLELRLQLADGTELASIRPRVEAIARSRLDKIDQLQDELLAAVIPVY
ncbi:MAG: methionine adenosyltransferase [Thiohalophilus sp.]|uniref:methionine adenosyltransferase n=1 Tax=Thiohalophilus sp. TaxID=3028392 RepID=UPI00286FD952|nr:methionine adenosyltransferase [Thiohalophilus sp.]MDR9436286.1 methionine adenosyltransferase [Thiohalophilus sp.]